MILGDQIFSCQKGIPVADFEVPQLFVRQLCKHHCLSGVWQPDQLLYGTAHNADALLKDLREWVEIVKQSTPIDSSAIRGMIRAALQSSDPETGFGQLAASAGLAGTELPNEMAFINEVLDALPDELCNAFLVNYFNDLYV